MKIGAQTYTIRDHTQDVDSFARSMEKLYKIGYRTVQISKIGDIPAKEVRRYCDENGLSIIMTHTDPVKIRDKTDQVIEDHVTMGTKYVGIGAMPAVYKKSFEDVKRFVADYRPVSEKIHKAGLLLMYHNHTEEFARFDGMTVMDFFAEEFDKDKLGFILDTCWVQAGGCDPAWWIGKLCGRIPAIHFKDMVFTLDRQLLTVPVMEGNLNWEAIFAAVRRPEVGVEYIFVEQDQCHELDPFDALAISLKNLTDAGFSA